MNNDDYAQAGAETQARFPSQTQWTLLIRQATDSSSPQAQEALNELCRIYWPPIYAFLRSQRMESHRAKDLTQGFFAHLLEGNLIKEANREKGRFRTFLHACLDNFIKDQWRHEAALKRGGCAAHFSINDAEAEEKCRTLLKVEPAPAATFDQAWAATVIDQALGRLRIVYTQQQRAELFEILRGCLSGELTSSTYPEQAAKLGMSSATFQTNLSRFKDRFSGIVREVVAETVDPAEINDEIRHLMAAWTAHLHEKL